MATLRPQDFALKPTPADTDLFVFASPTSEWFQMTFAQLNTYLDNNLGVDFGTVAGQIPFMNGVPDNFNYTNDIIYNGTDLIVLGDMQAAGFKTPTGLSTEFLKADGSVDNTVYGTVTEVNTGGSVNGLSLTGGPINTTGTVTLQGTLAINDNDWVGIDLAVANGGTGQSSFTLNGVLFASATNVIATSGNLIFDGSNLTVSGHIFYQVGIDVHAANYTMTNSDNGKIIKASGNIVISVPASGITSGWTVMVQNIGTGQIVIDDNGQTINSIGIASPLLVDQWTGCTIDFDGTTFTAIGKLT